MVCLANTVCGVDTAVRTLFRLRGEGNRVIVANALMRTHYESLGLKSQYEQSLEAVNHCKHIRNQFAHCHWNPDPEVGLLFTNLEDAARATEQPLLRFSYVDLLLLTSQEQYFHYTCDCLHFLSEAQKTKGNISNNSASMPNKLPKPPLCLSLDDHPLAKEYPVQ
jgi:hypothetical protein